MLGIIGAMETEVSGIISELEGITTKEVAGMTFNKGILNGKEVVVVKCGIGKVNAGVCVQILVDCFNVDAVINTGVAGSLSNEIDILDIVISDRVVQHDMNVTALGYRQGQIPGNEKHYWEADEKLKGMAVTAANEVSKSKVTFADTDCDMANFKIHIGGVATGDLFVNDAKTKDKIVSEFDSVCAEMEGGAIAQVCDLNNIPFLIIRAISDKADGSSHMDYREFEEKAAKNSIKLIHAFVNEL